MGTLSAMLSLNARRTTCHQPRGGISVGFSASSPASARRCSVMRSLPPTPAPQHEEEDEDGRRGGEDRRALGGRTEGGCLLGDQRLRLLADLPRLGQCVLPAGPHPRGHVGPVGQLGHRDGELLAQLVQVRALLVLGTLGGHRRTAARTVATSSRTLSTVCRGAADVARRSWARPASASTPPTTSTTTPTTSAASHTGQTSANAAMAAAISAPSP